LRDDASFCERAKELNIQWYTGRQNKVQNSVTAWVTLQLMFSADDFDICILEESEHRW
jgi:hypothetical protein